MNESRPPAHPGAILRRQYMQPLVLSTTQLAQVVGVSRKTLSRITNEHASVSADMALRLGKAFDTTPELWLNLQRNYDLWHAAHSSSDWANVRRIAVP